MREVFLSFIIPAYNSEKYLEECLQSILNQTDEEFEIVIINDGSTDKTGEIISRLQTQYPGIIRCFEQNNKGISAARNKGIFEAKGEYITFVDHDDLIEDTYVEKVKRRIRNNNFDMLVFGYATIDQYGNVRKKLPVSPDVKWAKWGVCTVWLIVAKRSLYIDNNILFPEGLFNEDVPVAIKLSFCSQKFGVLQEILYYYRVYVGNTCSVIHKKYEQAPESRENVFRVLREISDKVDELEAKKMIEYNAIKFYYGLLFVYFRNNTKQELLDEYEKYTLALIKYFPQYKQCRVFLSRPVGEPFVKRLAVWVSVKFDRLGMFKWLLLVINRKV